MYRGSLVYQSMTAGCKLSFANSPNTSLKLNLVKTFQYKFAKKLIQRPSASALLSKDNGYQATLASMCVYVGIVCIYNIGIEVVDLFELEAKKTKESVKWK